MQAREFDLRSGDRLVIREVAVAEASTLLDYVAVISGESNYLSFGPGEFELTESEEEDFIRQCLDADNHLLIEGIVAGTLVSLLHFAAGHRPRMRHAGEFGMSVLESHWGLGIGSLMMDTLVDWARATGIVTKINLRVRTDNHRAIRLYLGKGFTTEGTIRRELRIGDDYFDFYWMGLVL